MRFVGEDFGSAGPGTVNVFDSGEQYELNTGYDNDKLPSHSPDGFQCGYNGSGPAQLAAALLNEVYDEEMANKHYQQFKEEVVSNLDGDWWQLEGEDIREWVNWNC